MNKKKKNDDKTYSGGHAPAAKSTFKLFSSIVYSGGHRHQ